MTEFVMARIGYGDGGRTDVEVTRAGYDALVADGILRPVADGVALATNGEADVDAIMFYARHVVEERG